MLTPTTAYMIKSASPRTINVTGSAVPLTTRLTVGTGWTFLPMLHQSIVALATGLPAIAYSDQDQIKSPVESLFAVYCEWSDMA